MDMNALMQQQGASLGTSWSHFTTEWAPRAQQGLRWSVWQHKCQNSISLTVQYLIRGQRFVPVREHKTEKCPSSENSVRLLNCALFTPDSAMGRISSSILLVRECSDTALSETLTGWYQMGAAEGPDHTEDNTDRQFTALPCQKYCIKKRTKCGSTNTGACWWPLFFHHLHSNISPNWQGMKDPTLIHHFFVLLFTFACWCLACVLGIFGILSFWLNPVKKVWSSLSRKLPLFNTVQISSLYFEWCMRLYTKYCSTEVIKLSLLYRRHTHCINNPPHTHTQDD